MNTLSVTGGAPLRGVVRISGAKNSALKLMAASLLAPGRSRIENVPRIDDCRVMAEVLEHLGAGVAWHDGGLSIDAAELHSQETPYELVSKMRASIIVLGPLLGRFGQASVAMPGGCNIGSRSIQLHVQGLQQMGVVFASEHGELQAKVDGELRGATIRLDYPSVGATENLLMAATRARGTTVIQNAAREPEIVDLAAFLTTMGAKISGEGETTIEVEGVDSLAPTEFRTIPDRIEAGTFALAACATRGDVVLREARADHMKLLVEAIVTAGGTVEEADEGLRVAMPERPRAVDFATLPYPGFATDLQPLLLAVLATADGTSIGTENVFEQRFMFVDELNRMGADIRIEGHHAVVRGVERLSGAPVRAQDLRAGASLVIAALGAEGVTEIADMQFVDRGYEDFETKLTSLGAHVRRTRETREPVPIA